MPSGTLEVELIKGQNLKSRDAFSMPDAYCIVQYGNHTVKSNVARHQGSAPTWNQTFKFDVECNPTDAYDKHKITFKVLDEDLVTADDVLGQFEIDGKKIIFSGLTEWNQNTYDAMCVSGKKKGEIQVGVRFLNSIDPGPKDLLVGPPLSRRTFFESRTGPYGAGCGGGWD